MLKWMRIAPIFVVVFMVWGYFLASPSPALAAACNQACGGSITCNAGLTCQSGICYTTINKCNGTATCTAGGYDGTNACSADQCTPAGTTRTAAWSAPGTCSATCGSGTTTLTCTCGSQNNCSASCTNPAATCGGTTTQACCVSQAPQSKPVITSVGNSGCGAAASLPINWTFGSTTGCGSAWGYFCSGNVNTFTIKVDGVVNTTGIASTATSTTITTSAAASHQIEVCAENGFGENCSTVYTVTMDNSAPPVPVPTVQAIADGSCTGKYFVDVSWAPVSDVGCGGMNATPYWSQMSPDPAFGSVIFGWNNTWDAATHQTSSTSYAPGTVLYAHVRSRDTFDQQSAWSPNTSLTIPTPSPYPPIHVSGGFTEDINSTCFANMNINTSSLTLQPTIVPAAVTPVCTHTSTGYDCNLTIDNTQGQCLSNSISAAMSGTYTGYTLGWRVGDVCAGATDTRTLTAGNSYTIPIFFAYNAAPTPVGPTITPGGPTPTPALAPGWFKIKDSAFINRQNGRQNIIPYTLSAYDADDNTSTHHMLIGTAGGLVQGSPSLVVGANAMDAQGAPVYSTPNWYTTGYTQTDDVDASKYINYVESRRTYTSITSLADITTSGVYLSTAPLTISDASIFNGKNVVLIAKGTSITYTALTPTTGSLALVAQSIAIDPTVTTINGILVADTMTLGSGTQGLKVVGNVIVKNPMTIDRSRPDASKPSFFVVMSTSTYVNLLPYFSVSTYDWTQN